MKINWFFIIIGVIILVVILSLKKRQFEWKDTNYLLCLVVGVCWIFTAIGFDEKLWLLHLHYTGLWNIAEEDFFEFWALFARYSKPFLFMSLIWRVIAWLDNKKGIGLFMPTIHHFFIILPVAIQSTVTIVLVQFDESLVFWMSDCIMDMAGSNITAVAGFCSMILAMFTLFIPPKNEKKLS